MTSYSLRRITSRISTLALGMFGTILLSTSVGNAQSVVQITNFDGTILPSAASLYTVLNSCYSSSSNPPASICTWVVRKLYGDNSAVVVVAHYPNGTSPACYSGVTQTITSGYTRSSCALYATTAAYGH